MPVTALNGVCPYYTMYLLDFPLRVLSRAGKSGEWVLDPFCGRGTTNFAARLLGMPSVGVDSSPVAAALAKAKLVHASPAHVVAGAQAILNAARGPSGLPTGAFWELAYHQDTLGKLCRLRDSLLVDCSSPTRILLRAIILGALHGPRPKGKPSYFSNQSPRTFAPKPNYAVKFWNERNMRPEAVDVLAIIQARAERYLAEAAPDIDGTVQLADSREPETFPRFAEGVLGRDVATILWHAHLPARPVAATLVFGSPRLRRVPAVWCSDRAHRSRSLLGGDLSGLEERGKEFGFQRPPHHPLRRHP